MTATNTKVAAVTTAFGASDQEPLRRSLNALERLRFDRVILAVDVKDPHGRRAGQQVMETCGGDMEVSLLEVDDYGTARRWRYPIRKAFNDDPKPPWVLHLPGDLIKDL